MKASILDPQHILFEGFVSEVILPGADGQVSIMDFHESLYLALGAGLITIIPQEGEFVSGENKGRIRPIKIHQGLARVVNNELVVLVE